MQTMTIRRSRFLKVVVILSLAGVIVSTLAQGILTMLAASPLLYSVLATTNAYPHDWGSLLAWKRVMYREHVKPNVDSVLPTGIELPDLPK